MNASAAKQRRGLSAGWIASIIFHVLLLGWLLFFSPVRVIDLSAKKTPANVSASRARQVMEQVREKQVAPLSENLRELQQIHTELAELEKAKRQEFLTYAREVGKDAPAQALEAMEATLREQTNLLAVLNEATAKADLFVKTRANAYFDDLVEAHSLARDTKAKVSREQERALEALSLGDDAFAPVLLAQKEALNLQEEAAKALEAAEAARDPARSSRQRTPLEHQIEHYTYHLKRAQRDLAKLPGELVTLTNQLALARSALAAAQAAADRAAANAQQHDTPQARQQAESAAKALEQEQKVLKSAERKLESAQKELQSAPQRLAENGAKVKQLLAEPAPATPTPTPQDQQLLDLQARARQLQAAAHQAQTKARTAVAGLRASPAGTNIGRAALAELEKAAAADPPVPSQFQATNLAEIYSAAVKLETASAESYRRFRATELAMLRRMPLSRALQMTEVAKVVRPNLQATLQTPIQSSAEVATARDAVQTARAEIGAMVELGHSLLAQARGLDRSQGSSVSADDYRARMAQWEKMEMLAAEDDTAWAKDLTPYMGSAEGGFGEGTGAPGGGGSGDGLGDGSGGPGGGGFGGGGSGSGGPGGAGWFPGGSGLRGNFNPDNRRLPALPGRRIGSRGDAPPLAFVDSWYILGPFDNSRRANLNKKFPPETVIDLNAVYPGKNGVPIRWEFYQSGKPNITPPLKGYNAAYNQDPELPPEQNYKRNLQYIIYYAYSELSFQTACDLWVAVGSDDFSKVWVDDQLIWTSGKQLKAWRADEGFRKVHFKQGINRILCRVENANDRTEFSFLVCLQGNPFQRSSVAQDHTQ